MVSQRNSGYSARRQRRFAVCLGAMGAVIGIGLVAGSISGCNPAESTAGAAPAGQPAGNGGASTQKPTAQQDAAKQRAIEDGPAIQAAVKAQQGH